MPLTEMDKWAVIKIAEYSGKPIPQIRREYMKLPLPAARKALKVKA